MTEGSNLIYVNDISNKMLSYVSEYTDFLKPGDVQVNPIDFKMFYLYEAQEKISKNKKKSKDSSHSTENSV